MNLTGISLLNTPISAVGISNIRSGSTEYQTIDGVIVSSIGQDRLSFKQGFKYLGGSYPEVKSQTIEINKDGSSPIVYTNKPGVSNSIAMGITTKHWFYVDEWNPVLQTGISVAGKDFDISVIGSTPITYY